DEHAALADLADDRLRPRAAGADARREARVDPRGIARLAVDRREVLGDRDEVVGADVDEGDAHAHDGVRGGALEVVADPLDARPDADRALADGELEGRRAPLRHG